ncbi:MAG: Gfo/Idh/MocA family oxidoreductase [Deltaproteobacteria bacterium]|nr:Gfo/Idh/MocA family oxidoreductase [Deltaproteobacteria bacterium]
MSQSDTRRVVRVGLVGCGRLAEFGYLPAFRKIQGVTLVASADINPARCLTLASHVPAYDSIQSLIRAGGVDALVLSVPTRFHLEHARYAAEAGLPALVEKPPGANAQEAKDLQALKAAAWVGFNRRFEPQLTALKQSMSSAQGLGLRLELHYRRTTWKPFDMHDDALLDVGPHLIDLAQWLTESQVCSVRTLSLGEKHAEFELDLSRGRAVVACSTNRPYRERVDITDVDGRLRASYRRGGLVPGIVAKLRPQHENPLVRSLTAELQAFARAVRGGSSGSLASVADGVAVMSVIEAVRNSAVRGGAACHVQSQTVSAGAHSK